ncbi:hypothetical protein, partial [Salmonella enterica]|uniref:hypothetical protein n=1 Tax=Salmonella enterica TaxID=28901 RepID=UPI003075CF57
MAVNETNLKVRLIGQVLQKPLWGHVNRCKKAALVRILDERIITDNEIIDLTESQEEEQTQETDLQDSQRITLTQVSNCIL